jgi:hypothetical protein
VRGLAYKVERDGATIRNTALGEPKGPFTIAAIVLTRYMSKHGIVLFTMPCIAPTVSPFEQSEDGACSLTGGQRTAA